MVEDAWLDEVHISKAGLVRQMGGMLALLAVAEGEDEGKAEEDTAEGEIGEKAGGDDVERNENRKEVNKGEQMQREMEEEAGSSIKSMKRVIDALRAETIPVMLEFMFLGRIIDASSYDVVTHLRFEDVEFAVSRKTRKKMMEYLVTKYKE
ncbi:hypothetical protein FACS189472_15530 [Alphaproteobacteria bacterium]|nr:hypothetical protein FACS189472_15530 [Alphaproteobacteria bacterium]